MATVVSSPEQLVILDNVTWETYERLINEHGERCGTRSKARRGWARFESGRALRSEVHVLDKIAANPAEVRS